MNDYYLAIYNSLIYAGLISFLIGIFSSNQVSLGAYITGYSVFILALLMILIIVFSKANLDLNNFSVIGTILNISGPFLLILGIIGFILYLIITYYNNIVENHITKDYYRFTNIIILLLFIQFYIIHTNINTSKFNETGRIPKITNYILYLLNVICIMCSIILGIILKYYTTDGFSLLKI
jgi:hypothetical protein